MRKAIVGIICFLILLGFSNHTEAQLNRKTIKKNNKRMASFKGKKFGFKNKAYSGIGISLNSFHYLGDLAPKSRLGSTDLSFTKPGVGASFIHRFGPRYTLFAGYLHGSVSGSDAESADPNSESGKYRYQRNLTFRNRIHELAVTAYFDLFDNTGRYISRVKWTPYAFTGMVLFYHNPQAQAPSIDLQGNSLAQAGEWVDLRPLGTEGQYANLLSTDVNSGIKPYSHFQFAIPLGLGVRFRLNDVLDLWVEFSTRRLFTDYLDDVSKNYVDLGVLDSPLAKAMSYRSNELPPNELPPLVPYVGRDGVTYNTISGYGSEGPSNTRGSSGGNDVYFVSTIRLSYILGATLHRAKFR